MSSSTFNFSPQTAQFSALNALRLAEAAELAYGPADVVEKKVRHEWGFAQFKYFQKGQTQGFLAANDEIFLFVFPGTACVDDWRTDAKIKLVAALSGKVHFGFQEALGSIWEEMFKTFWEWEKPDKTLWLTGHSLGGALATLAAYDLLKKDFPLGGLYTFGQPCVGDKNFCKDFTDKAGGRAFRFVNDEDLVPRLLPWFGYCHCGKEYFIDRDGKIHDTKVLWNWWRSVSSSVAIRSSKEAAELRMENPGGIRDHGMSFYIQALKARLSAGSDKTKTFKEYINS